MPANRKHFQETWDASKWNTWGRVIWCMGDWLYGSFSSLPYQPLHSYGSWLYFKVGGSHHHPKKWFKVVLTFLKKNIIIRFGTPRALLSDNGTHFCNKPLELLLKNMGYFIRSLRLTIPKWVRGWNSQIENWRASWRKQWIGPTKIGPSSLIRLFGHITLLTRPASAPLHTDWCLKSLVTCQ